MLSLDFSATNHYLIRSANDSSLPLGSSSDILSGGADNLILRFDISRLEVGSGQGTHPAQDVYRRHDVSPTTACFYQPYQPNHDAYRTACGA